MQLFPVEDRYEPENQAEHGAQEQGRRNREIETHVVPLDADVARQFSQERDLFREHQEHAGGGEHEACEDQEFPGGYHSRFTTSLKILVSLGSALLAAAMTSASVTGFSVSGKHSSVMIEQPRTRIPIWIATMSSGTVDMPTASPPIPLRKRYSARVSRFGP